MQSWRFLVGDNAWIIADCSCFGYGFFAFWGVADRYMICV